MARSKKMAAGTSVKGKKPSAKVAGGKSKRKTGNSRWARARAAVPAGSSSGVQEVCTGCLVDWLAVGHCRRNRACTVGLLFPCETPRRQ